MHHNCCKMLHLEHHFLYHQTNIASTEVAQGDEILTIQFFSMQDCIQTQCLLLLKFSDTKQPPLAGKVINNLHHMQIKHDMYNQINWGKCFSKLVVTKTASIALFQIDYSLIEIGLVCSLTTFSSRWGNNRPIRTLQAGLKMGTTSFDEARKLFIGKMMGNGTRSMQLYRML